MAEWRIINADCRDALKTLDAGSVQTCVTSPPYFGLRDYGHGGQIGLEPTPGEFVEALVEVFREVKRVLRDDGTVWLNLGDSYAGSGRGMGDTATTNKGNPASKDMHDAMVDAGAIGRAWVKPPPGLKQKDLIGIPWMVAFALRADGWYLRQDIIWHKPNPMPESVTDRCTKAHEYVFLLSKSRTYNYDHEAIKEDATGEAPGNLGGTHRQQAAYEDGDDRMRTKSGLTKIGAVEKRNKRSVWTVTTKPFSGAHFATFPPDLIEPCILAGSSKGDTVLDPFSGSGTTGMVALRHGRSYIGCELNPEYVELSRRRIVDDAPLLNQIAEAA